MSVLEVTRRLHVYNRWANARVLCAMDGLTADDLASAAPVAFGNMRGALWHLAGAQMGWLGLCSGIDTWSKLPVSDPTSVEGLRGVIEASDAMWSEFIASLSEDDVLRPIELPMDENYVSSVGADLLAWSREQGHRPLRPMWQSMLHVVNHSTQHRAEIGIHIDSLGRSPDDMDYGSFEEYRAANNDVELPGAIR